jgi:proteic killer suppression protein
MVQTSAPAKSFEIWCGRQPPLSPCGQNSARIVRLVVRPHRTRLDDLVVPAGKRLELLKSDQAGRHSIRMNERYRVTFRWDSGHAYEVRVEDYH